MVDEQKLRQLAELLLLQSSEIAAALHNGWGNSMSGASVAILSLLDELQTMREERTAWRVTAENAEKDAARYCRLVKFGTVDFIEFYWSRNTSSKKAIDAAIDAAMKDES